MTLTGLDPCRSHDRFRYEPLRWYLGSLIFALSFAMGFIWNMFNALSAVSEQVLGLSEQAIEYDVLIGSAILAAAAPFVAYVIDSGRFRRAMITSSLCLCIGAWTIMLGVIRSSKLVVCIGLAFNGLSGPMAMFGGAAFSDLWFPPHQRTQATSLLCSANYLGVGFAFLVGATTSETDPYNGELIYLTGSIAAITTVVVLCVLVKFPSAPAKPVSCSQHFRKHIGRPDLSSQYASLFTNTAFLRIGACYGLGSGLYAGWCGSLSENLASFGMDQAHSGWIGTVSLLGGFLGATIGSMIVDRRQCSLQNMAIVLFSISSCACALFICGCHLQWSLYALIPVAGVLGAGINGTIPILFELALETTYPILNAAIGNVLTIVNGLGTVVFLCVPIATFGARWMNWVCFLASLISIPIIFAGKIQCARSEYDAQGVATPLLDQDDQ